MALVHRGFRRELHDASDLVRGVEHGDRRRTAVVGDHIGFLVTAVNAHHSAEDKVVWPKLSARAPGHAADARRMEDAHRVIDDASERVRGAATRWAATGDSPAADELVGAVDAFAALVDDHFDDEEDNVVPLIAEYLDPREWRKFLAHGSAFVRTHPRRGLALGGMVLDGVSAETRKRFLGNVPLPARGAFTMVGDRVYAGYRAQVYGSP